MPYTCCILKCRGNSVSGPKVRLYKFPNDPEMRKKWVDAIPRTNFTPSRSSKVCELHFLEEDIIKTTQVFDHDRGETVITKYKFPKLRPQAVPSRFNDCPCSTMEDGSSLDSEGHNCSNSESSGKMFLNQYNINDFDLIRLVETSPELWQISHPDYGNPVHKSEVWTKIGNELGFEGNVCRSRWVNIRDNYRRSLKRSMQDSNAKMPKYEEVLTFLKNELLEGQKKAQLQSSFFADATQILDSDAEFEKAIASISDPSASRKRLIRSDDDDTEGYLNVKKLRRSTSSQNIQGSSSVNAVKAFLAGLAPTLKGLTPFYQNLAKSKIFLAVQEYELLMLTEQQKTQVKIEDDSFYEEAEDLVDSQNVDIKENYTGESNLSLDGEIKE